MAPVRLPSSRPDIWTSAHGLSRALTVSIRLDTPEAGPHLPLRRGSSMRHASIMAISPPPVPTIGLVSLGCPKALVDSERIITQLRAEGYRLASGYDGADVVIVN